MKTILNIFLITLLLFTISSCDKDDKPAIEKGTVSDKEGNTYETVKIGSQTWMAEDLRTTKFNDNSDIPNITDNELWAGLTTPGYCWYDNNISNKTIYGAIYNWHAVNTGKLAPEGWHVATKEDWEQLISYLGGESVAGAKLKETGIAHWASPNDEATNETGFTALPNGYRSCTNVGFVFDINYDGKFRGIGYGSYWWTATEDLNYPGIAWSTGLVWNLNGAGHTNGPQGQGFYVRCVKD